MPIGVKGFQPGHKIIGNPRGRPPGVTAMSADKLLNTSVDAILERVIEAAIGGDIAAAAVALEHFRLMPGPTERTASRRKNGRLTPGPSVESVLSRHGGE